MKKEIKIDKDNKFEINTSLGFLYVYEEEFGRDILPELVPLIESILGAAADALENDVDVRDIISEAMGAFAGTNATTITNILWAMAKNADEDIPGPRDWFNSFDKFPADEIFLKAFWSLCDSSISSKKAKRLKAMMEKTLEKNSLSTN